MKLKINKGIRIPAPFFFIIAILIITFFAPQEKDFAYSYSEGRPWRYSLLTAPFDFPIYKPDKQVEQEKDSILSTFQPYYKFDKSIGADNIANFEKDAAKKEIPHPYIEYIKKELTEIYKVGIISLDAADQISKSKTKSFMEIEDKDIAYTSRTLSEVYTSKQAYQRIISDVPEHIEIPILQSLNFNEYITNNILYDKATSDKMKNELVQQISPAEGAVQSGERIIDRGEIIDSYTYNILKSLEKVTEERGSTKNTENWRIVGVLIMVTVFIMSFMLYLIFFRSREYNNRKSIIFMLMMITLACVITGFSIEHRLANVYIIPYAIPIILIRTFIDSRTAMTSHMVTTLICTMFVPFPVEFMLMQIPVGFMCIFGLKDLTERSQLIKCSFFILLTYVVTYSGIVLWQEGDITHINWKMFLYFGINFIFVMFSYLLVYMCEKVFGFISGVSMVELSNINKPVLQKLSENAPGTFQHSMQVANLASAAAMKIGANASLVRTGALYHDIGKLTNPAFFTENQIAGTNPHKNLDYKDSAQIIIGHVSEGEKLAKANNLPQQIIDFIKTHHGKGKARFFYNSYKNEHPDEEIDETLFTYPGPNPYSKETAILMMADTVEAASRSLKEYSDESISELVNRLIDLQMSEGLLKNAPLTFRDVEDIKEVFCEKLKTIYHTRITYPELNK